MTFLEFRKKMNGIFLPGIVAGVFMVGLISTTIAAITATSFSTLGATKTASQAQQFGQAEAEYIKIMGYNNYASLVHGRQSMEELVGEDGAKYQSKVEVADTSTNGEGREVKVMKINVYKGNEINSRYSEEIPLVSGLDYSEKFDAINKLIDALRNRVNSLEINLKDLSAKVTNLSDRMSRAEKNITLINADLDKLEELINKNADAIKANKSSIDKNTKDIAEISKQLVQAKGDISDLRTSLNTLSTKLNQEIADRKAGDNSLSSKINQEIADRKAGDSNLSSRINQEIADRKAADTALQKEINNVKSDMASLQTTVDLITGRLNGKEFVKNKDKVNDISLNYENGDDGKKTIVAYVDGTKVPLSSQGGSYKQLFSQNGYSIMPNGLIFVWGRGYLREGYTDVDKLIRVNFPISFYNKCLNVSITTSFEVVSGNGESSALYPCKIDNNGFYVNTDTVWQIPSDYYYFAIGY